MKPNRRLGRAVLLAGLTLAFGCTKEGKSLIPVVVDAMNSGLTGAGDVTVTVTQSGHNVAQAVFHEDGWATPLNLGIRVPADVTGSVMVSATASDGAGHMAASLAVEIPVAAGKTAASVALMLVPMSTSGTGGAGGSASGTGGAGGGSGGAPNPGSGGIKGTGGVPGSGGVPPGTGGIGSGGAAGSGMGTGGVAGKPGTGGSAGAGGAGGMGGAAGKGGRSWRGAGLAETNKLVDDYTPQVAVDAKGNIVATYQHGSGLAAAYYDITKGTWGPETVIDGRDMTSIAETTALAVDKNGNWLAVWQQDADGPLHGIWQSTSADGTHWTAPAAITTTGKLFEPVLGMNQDGTAVVAWIENVPPDNSFTLTASARVNGTWTAPHVLRAGDDTSERYPQVAVTSTGTGIVIWEQGDGTTANQLSVWQARFMGGSWSAASLVETYTGGSADSANVATNGAGQAILTWIQNTDTMSALWAQRYPATGAPEAPVKVTEGANIAWTPPPAVTLDEAGAATLAWAFEVKSKFEVYTTRAVWGQPWAAIMAMETDDDATDDKAGSNDYAWVTNPMVGHDAAGNVTLVWKKRTGPRFDMWARNYDAASATWSNGTLLETMDANNVYAPVMAMGPSGVAVAAWYYGYGYEIWANIYR